MFDIFEEYRSPASNYAPFSDLEVVLSGESNFSVRVNFFAKAGSSSAPDCGETIQHYHLRPAVLIPTSGQCQGAPENAVALLDRAITWGIYRDNQNCHLAYDKWGYSINLHVVTFFSTAQDYSKSFKACRQINGSWTVSGTGDRYEEDLWGAYETYNNGIESPRDPYECLVATELQSWEAKAESIIDNEEGHIGSIIFDASISYAHYNKSFTVNYYYHKLLMRAGFPGLIP